MSSPRSRSRAAVVGMVALATVLSGCGSRTSGEPIPGDEAAVAVADPAAGGQPVPGAALPDASAVGSVPGAGGQPAPGALASGAPAAVPSNGPVKAGAKTAGGASGPAVTAAAAPCEKQLPPIVLGQTVATSGLLGAVIGNLRLGVSLWASMVNARGGVQCHPVVVYARDDGADAARAQSNINDFVTNRKAVALIGVGAPLTDGAVQSVINKYKIPIVGGDLNSVMWNNDPLIFPQGASGFAPYAGALQSAGAKAKAAGKTPKMGLVYCIEAQICSDIAKNFDQQVKWAGGTKGITKAISITQSDFTAECQAMKTDGTDVVFVGAEGSSTIRFARNCKAIGYQPVLAVAGLAINQSTSQDPGVRGDTTWLGTQVAPFGLSDTPGGKEFQDAVAQFGAGQAIDATTIQGFAAGKLFEAALAKVATEARSGPVTTALILNGLNSIKNETLGGLAPPLTFTAGQPHPPVNCYFANGITDKGWVFPNGSKPICFGGGGKSSEPGAVTNPEVSQVALPVRQGGQR